MSLINNPVNNEGQVVATASIALCHRKGGHPSANGIADEVQSQWVSGCFIGAYLGRRHDAAISDILLILAAVLTTIETTVPSP